MAITWGGASGELQLGIDTVQSPGTVSANTTSVSITVIYYIRATGYGHNFSDTLRMGGRVSGSIGYSFYSAFNSWTQKEIGRRTITVSTTTSSQTLSFNASTGPVWNGGTPSVSRSITIGARGYAAPRPPKNPKVVWQRDGLNRLSWTTDYDSAAGLQPWSGVKILRWDYKADTYKQVGSAHWSATTWDDTQAPLGESAWYRIVSYNSAGQTRSSPVYTSTRPLPPSDVAASRQATGVKVSWTVPPMDNYYTAFDVYDGNTKIGSAPGSAREWVHSNPAQTVPHTYRVVAWAENTTANAVSAGIKLASEKSLPSNTVQFLAPPYAPTVVSPNGDFVSSSDKTVLRWAHNPADSSEQTKYEIYSRQPGQSWTRRATKTSAEETCSLSFSEGPWEWRVRTWGAYKPSETAGASPFSTVATFYVAAPPEVSILSPESTYKNSRLRVAWSTFQTQGATQAGAKVKLSQGGTVLFEKTIQGSASVLDVPVMLSDASDYTVTVTVMSSHGIWSLPASQSFTTSFLKPVEPKVSLEWDETAGAVVAQIFNPPQRSGFVATESNRVERSTDGGRTWTIIADELPIQSTISDYEALSCGETLYRVTAVSALPSANTWSGSIQSDSDAMWIGAGPGYADTIRLPYDPQLSLTPTLAQRHTYRFAGRTMRVLVDGDGIDRSWQIKAKLFDDDPQTCTWKDVDRIALTLGAVCYRNPDGVIIYGAMSSPSLDRTIGGSSWTVSFNLEEVEA